MTTTSNEFLPVALNVAPSAYHPIHSHKGISPQPVFDQEYVNRLTSGDLQTERHFTKYFGDLLNMKLRARLRSSHLADDARQETFLRVLNALRKKGGIQHPERLGGFVNSVCEHVLLESFRTGGRYRQIAEDTYEPADESASTELKLISDERKTLIRSVLLKLSARDQTILCKVFLEERDYDEVCRELGLQRGNLRVRLHRALHRFRAAMLKDESGTLIRRLQSLS